MVTRDPLCSPAPIELLVVELDGRRHGIAAAHVVEVLQAVTTVPVPGGVGRVDGVMNLRGVVVPVVDLGIVCGRIPRAAELGDHLVVLRMGMRLVAARVDRAVELVRAEAGQEAGVARLDGELLFVHEPHALLADDVCAALAALGCWNEEAA